MHPENFCFPDVLWEKGRHSRTERKEGPGPTWELPRRLRWAPLPTRPGAEVREQREMHQGQPTQLLLWALR